MVDRQDNLDSLSRQQARQLSCMSLGATDRKPVEKNKNAHVNPAINPASSLYTGLRCFEHSI